MNYCELRSKFLLMRLFTLSICIQSAANDSDEVAGGVVPKGASIGDGVGLDTTDINGTCDELKYDIDLSNLTATESEEGEGTLHPFFFVILKLIYYICYIFLYVLPNSLDSSYSLQIFAIYVLDSYGIINVPKLIKDRILDGIPGN